MNKQKRFLIVRQDRLGDVVLATPLPREIKKIFPGSYVVMLVREYTAELFKNNPNVDEVIVHPGVYSSFSDFLKLVSKLRKYKFTHSFTLLPSSFLGWAMFWTGIKTRVGVGFKFYQFITGSKSVSRNNYIPLRSEADYALDFLRKIGGNPASDSTEIHLSDQEKREVLKKRSELLSDNNSKILIGLHVGSGGSAPNISIYEYLKLAKKLDATGKVKIVITDNEPIADFTKEGFHFPNANLKLRNSIINFAAIDLLISASTGPMHIAAALKVDTLSLFCRMTACAPELWGPMGNNSTILLPTESYCTNKCPGDPKRCKFEGDGGINSNTVLDAVNLIIKKREEFNETIS